MSKTYLHLIRHGITEGNQKNWIYGGIDIPLAPEGEAALAALRDQGIYPNYDDTEYWTSGMRRTEQTLSILFGPRPHRRIPAMKEISFGIYEAHTFDELKGDPVYDRWLYDKTGTVVPEGGESVMQFKERITAGFQEFLRLRDPAYSHTTLVCHGGPIGLLRLQLFGGRDPKTGKELDRQDPRNMYYFVPDPGRGYTLVLENGSFTGCVAI